MLLTQIGDGRTLEHTVRLDSWIIDTPLQLAVCECEFFANRFERRRRPCRRKQNFPDWLDVGKLADAWKYRPFQVRPGSSCSTSATNSHISG